MSRDQPVTFLGWLAIGTVFGLGAVTPFTIGSAALLLVGVLSMLALLRWPPARNSTSLGLISGAGIVPLYVAYLNRSGPGSVCTTGAYGSVGCTDLVSPWPWVLAGLALLTVGVAAFAFVRHARGKHPGQTAGQHPSEWTTPE